MKPGGFAVALRVWKLAGGLKVSAGLAPYGIPNGEVEAFEQRWKGELGKLVYANASGLTSRRLPVVWRIGEAGRGGRKLRRGKL